MGIIVLVSVLHTTDVGRLFWTNSRRYILWRLIRPQNTLWRCMRKYEQNWFWKAVGLSQSTRVLILIRKVYLANNKNHRLFWRRKKRWQFSMDTKIFCLNNTWKEDREGENSALVVINKEMPNTRAIMKVPFLPWVE